MQRFRQRAAALTAAVTALGGLTAGSARAELLLYDPFDYAAGSTLGGTDPDGAGPTAGTPVGLTNAYTGGGTWYARGTASNYQSPNDAVVSAGSLTYNGLATSVGNSVSYGSATGNLSAFSDTIDVPGLDVTTGSLYTSFIVRIKSTASTLRHSPAGFVTDTTNAGNAGLALASGSGTATTTPGLFWMRRDPVTPNVTNFSPGKSSSDGIAAGAIGPSAGWQDSRGGTNLESNQFGDRDGQAAPNFADANTYQTYFVVLKYAFDQMSSTNGQTDTVSLWMNPGSGTLGQANGETLASQNPTGNLGSYFAAVNAFGTATVDSPAIRSFALIGHRQNQTDSIAVDFDELRIGTTWADVTPLASQVLYWDTNNTTDGAGGPTPDGNWDGATPNFNSDSTGAGGGTLTNAPGAADTVVFAAGSDATGDYTVTVNGTRAAGTARIEEGNVRFSGGELMVGTFDVAAGASARVESTLASGGVIKTGPGTLTLDAQNSHGATTVNAGTLVAANADAFAAGNLTVNNATVEVQLGRPKAVTVNTLAITGTGELDLTDNDLVIKSGTLAGVTAQIVAGYNNGTWDGPGINSSAAATDPNADTAIGFFDNAEVQLTSFSGVILNGPEIVVKYTYYGDADLTGVVDTDDFQLFLAGYQDNTLPRTWFYGDFDYTGVIDTDDFQVFLYGYQNQGGALSELAEAVASAEGLSAADRAFMQAAIAAVPEPASTAVLIAGMLGLGARRRLRRSDAGR